jgi:hypothetical protein
VEPVKVPATKDEGPVQDLASDGAHPTLGEGVGPRGTDRGEDDPRTLGPEH